MVMYKGRWNLDFIKLNALTDKVHVEVNTTTELITATNYQLHAIYLLQSLK